MQECTTKLLGQEMANKTPEYISFLKRRHMQVNWRTALYPCEVFFTSCKTKGERRYHFTPFKLLTIELKEHLLSRVQLWLTVPDAKAIQVNNVHLPRQPWEKDCWAQHSKMLLFDAAAYLWSVDMVLVINLRKMSTPVFTSLLFFFLPPTTDTY